MSSLSDNQFPVSSLQTTSAGWVKSGQPPILGGALGVCFDPAILVSDGLYRLYFSWRTKHSIAVVESVDGATWGKPVICLAPDDGAEWEQEVNRQIVVFKDGVYHMWYTGQVFGEGERSAIGYATSTDGRVFRRVLARPVMVPDQPWELSAVMCPHVEWNGDLRLFQMWYSGGEQYEPDAIGYATSPDGIEWTKHGEPVFSSDRALAWEQQKVTACQIVRHGGWHYMFYIGFRNVHQAAIGIARSRDGIMGWERLPQNPVISPTPGAWDGEAVYKPTALWDGSQWKLWYNGRQGHVEQIGLATRLGEDLWL
ncbi:MAG: hypothetical protein P4L33_16390 [Capsulimonadaceae bacterium]|nr:hypothetical protein [Capsulimonadaceae bacterium]